MIEKASIVINGTARIFVARKRLQRLRMERQKETQAAILIQSIALGHKEKKRYQQMHQAAICIQALIRVCNSRNALKRKRFQRRKENESISILQRCWRCYFARKQYLDLLNERKVKFYATQIQRSVRRGTGCDINSSSTVVELNRENAALIIQRSIRNMRTRKEIQQLTRLNKNIQAASQIIQPVFGGDAATTRTVLIERSGTDLEKRKTVDMDALSNQDNATTRLPHIMDRGSSDMATYSESTRVAKKPNEQR